MNELKRRTGITDDRNEKLRPLVHGKQPTPDGTGGRPEGLENVRVEKG
jgi:hypothetical protein